MTREQLEALIVTAPCAKGRQSQLRRVYGIEDYLFITGGHPYQLSARQAAQRLGVAQRTVTRWRKVLRDAS